MTTFDQAINFVLGQEGGYSDDPHDPGGETNFGISKRTYPDLDIKNLTREQAIEIYRRDFWVPLHGDELLPPIALALLDTAVNMGTQTAVRLLQSRLGVDVDGVIGPHTIQAANANADTALLTGLLASRIIRYSTLNPWAYFARTWVTRVLELQRAALTIT